MPLVVMRWWVGLLLLLLGLFQYRLWVGDGSLAEVWQLHQRIDAQEIKNTGQKEKNQALEAEVEDLKQGRAAIEERAREELGMIRDDETFYQVIDDDGSYPAQ
ncbi:MAG: cell division protein FtsB [Gammaproteobacteria bacterium]